MEEKLEDRFFDLLLRTLNYAMEFVNERSYASLRFMDLFSSLLELQPLIKEISEDEFYEKLREKIKARRLMGDRETRSKLQNELLQMFIDEWKRRTSKKS
ncbi:hypothetical protein J7L60_05785 [Candidatus Bathyarchaeota archaeon]|nr:hypothetical protein [Candidatus Bathyarchaeota archaeon]